MQSLAPVTVFIPTYKRGFAVLSVLKKIQECDPRPAEIWVHVDLGDGELERELKRQFPSVEILSSTTRLGPGGGRHRCLQSCKTDFGVSFDDDSYPVDTDFFAQVQRLFIKHPEAAIFGASIWHRQEPEKARTEDVRRVPSYIGCGYAIRLAAYREVRGYISRPRAYGMEESDVSLQLFVAGWHIYEAGSLRVFHDTDRKHHDSPEITSGTITNVGLYAFLHYPAAGWGWGLAQLANTTVDSIRRGRMRGICSGFAHIPLDCYRNRQHRKPIPWHTLKRFLDFRRTGVL